MLFLISLSNLLLSFQKLLNGCVGFPHFQGAVIRKLCVTLVSLLLFLTLTKTFPVTCLTEEWFIHETNFWTQLCYLYIVTQASKPKYYFAWTLGEFDEIALNEGGNKETPWKAQLEQRFGSPTQKWPALHCKAVEPGSVWLPNIVFFSTPCKPRLW